LQTKRPLIAGLSAYFQPATRKRLFGYFQLRMPFLLGHLSLFYIHLTFIPKIW